MPAVAAVATVAGAGISAYGSYQQGQTAEAMGVYNAHQQELNTKMSLMQAQAQAAIQQKAAAAQFAMRQQEANAKFSNAKIIEAQVEGTSAAARETTRRKTEEYGRFMGSQRASIAANGFVESSGTPLDFLAQTAEKIQLEREDSIHQENNSRTSFFREADLERLGGHLALAGASLDRNSALAGASLTAASGMAAYRRGMREAEITRLTGQNDRYAANFQAAGTILNGIGAGADRAPKSWYT